MEVGASWYAAVPSDKLSVLCVTDFKHPLLGTQAVYCSNGPEEYASQIAPARTFGFRSEVDALVASGLALGGTLDNAFVIDEDCFSVALRFPEECTRHKIVDVIGDLSLAGRRISAAITAIKPSHYGNVLFAARLAAS